MQRVHSLGPSTENARRPHEFRWYDATTSWWPAAERRWRLCAISGQEHNRQLPCRGTDEAATSQDDDFILDALRHVKPVEIVMHQLRQAAVELPGTCCIHHTLQFVGDDLWSHVENDITIVHPWRYKGVDECRRRLRAEHRPKMSGVDEDGGSKSHWRWWHAFREWDRPRWELQAFGCPA